MAPELLTVTIQRLANGGAGVGFHQGRAVFVPFTAPGDQVRIAVTRQGKGHLLGELRQLILPGPERIEPVCPLYGRCGGCDLQHVASGVKEGLVRDALAHVGRLPAVAEAVAPLLAAPAATGYRRRAGFKVRWVGGKPLVGFFQLASHRVIDLDHCPVLAPPLAALLDPLRRLLPLLEGRERLPQVDVVAGEEGVGVIVHLIAPLSRRDRERLEAWARELDLAELWVQQGRKEGLRSLRLAHPLVYRVEGMALHFHAGDFIQTNLEQNRVLVAAAMALAGEGERAVELFCGVGNFTLPLARRFHRVTAWEGYGPALAGARENARRHALDRVTFQEGDLMAGWHPEAADLLLFDPPREGALAVVKALTAAAGRPRLVAIACDPVTLARDMAILVHGGYRVMSVQPIDMFPMTHHVEVVAGLEAGE